MRVFRTRLSHVIVAAAVASFCTVLPSVSPAQAQAAAGTFYVAPTGSPGGNGSQASPWVELANINWSAVAPNSTIVLAGGTYKTTMSVPSTARYVSIVANGNVVIDVGLANNGINLGMDKAQQGPNNISISGNIEITNADIGCAVFGGTGLAVTGVQFDNDIYGVIDAGVQSVYSTVNVFDCGTGVWFYNNNQATLQQSTIGHPDANVYSNYVGIVDQGQQNYLYQDAIHNNAYGVLAQGTGLQLKGGSIGSISNPDAGNEAGMDDQGSGTTAKNTTFGSNLLGLLTEKTGTYSNLSIGSESYPACGNVVGLYDIGKANQFTGCSISNNNYGALFELSPV